MDKSSLVSRLQNYDWRLAEKCTEKVLSDFQRMHFARYYANPFPLRKSAVMILLYVRDGRMKTIMIERTDIGVHAGQVSFPGGKCEPDDVDGICTAIRETAEEIGILVSRCDVVGELPPVKVPVSSFEIFPVVAFVDGVGDFAKSEDEVKRVIEVDMKKLSESLSGREVTVAGKQYEVPSYLCGNSVVWGATAMVAAELLEALGADL